MRRKLICINFDFAIIKNNPACLFVILVEKNIYMDSKMKVEIWSDIMCPFCYIGKRNYEAALQQFTGKDNVEVIWKSFQLDPQIPEYSGKPVNVYDYLAERKGISFEESEKLHQHVIQLAKNAGLEYNFGKAVVANSFKAHLMIQLAKTKGLGDKAEERLFHAYFTEGRDFGSPEVLVELGGDIGLSEAEVEEALTIQDYADKVEQDIQEGQDLGLNGVPFFVFNRQYAVAGAQAPKVILQTLEKSFSAWENEKSVSATETVSGNYCAPEGDCQ
jgi:predicted DsbA family dithiol-disulfide isomerase